MNLRISSKEKCKLKAIYYINWYHDCLSCEAKKGTNGDRVHDRLLMRLVVVLYREPLGKKCGGKPDRKTQEKSVRTIYCINLNKQYTIGKSIFTIYHDSSCPLLSHGARSQHLRHQSHWPRPSSRDFFRPPSTRTQQQTLASTSGTHHQFLFLK